MMSSALLAAATSKTDVFTQVIESRGMVLVVLIVLATLSLICWYIIGAKAISIARAIKNSRSFVEEFRNSARLADLFQQSDTLPDSPARRMFRAGHTELQLVLTELARGGGRPEGDGPAAAPKTDTAAFENVERTLAQTKTSARAGLEKYVPFLATVGSAAPFIGLFGTVWGIMNAFGEIDVSKPILQTVTPHIAQALAATAIGLLAAIPAVMAYNWLLGRLNALENQLADFGTEYLNIVRRHSFT